MSAARRLALSRLASLTAGSAAYIALISAIYNETGSALWVSAALFFGVVGSVRRRARCRAGSETGSSGGA